MSKLFTTIALTLAENNTFLLSHGLTASYQEGSEALEHLEQLEAAIGALKTVYETADINDVVGQTALLLAVKEVIKYA